jgi:hypothetical protein
MADVKSPKSVTVLTRDADGGLSVKSETTSAAKKKKKGTKGFGLVERIVRTGVNVGTAAGNSYLGRHKKSNEKKKDGWLKDAPVNVVRSAKGMKISRKFIWPRGRRSGRAVRQDARYDAVAANDG